MKKKQEKTQDVYIINRKARHEFTISETVEAGVVLSGGEVKSIRLGRVDLSDGFVRIYNNEATLKNVFIPPYQGIQNYNPKQDRRLLLHKKQILTFMGRLSSGGVSLIPTALYTKNNFIKVELGLATVKSKHDKRREIKKRDEQRNLEQEYS
jgi:SsrA-binding protein